MPVGTEDNRTSKPGRHRRPRSRSVPGRHRRRPGLPQVVKRAASVAACSTVGLALGVGVVPAVSSGPAFVVGGPWAGSDTESSPTRAERLVAEHDCWTGPAPESTLPGSAVVTLPGRTAAVVDSEVGFRVWVGPDDEPDTGDERAGDVHAFCP